jgi:hypothetical protein
VEIRHSRAIRGKISLSGIFDILLTWLSAGLCKINLHLIDKIAILAPMALRANTIITSNRSNTVVHTHRKHINSILFVVITLPEAATSSNKVPIVDFLALDHKFSQLHHRTERGGDISATYNGQRLAQSAVDHIRTSQAAIRTLFKLRLRYLINHHETPLRRLPMKMTIRSDLRRICRWRTRRKNLSLEQAENITVILSKRMLLNSASLSSRNHLQFLQLSLHQI